MIALCRNNEPYIVTLSYGYDEMKNALYFHSRLNGLKCEFIKENPNVCATIIERRRGTRGGYFGCGYAALCTFSAYFAPSAVNYFSHQVTKKCLMS